MFDDLGEEEGGEDLSPRRVEEEELTPLKAVPANPPPLTAVGGRTASLFGDEDASGQVHPQFSTLTLHPSHPSHHPSPFTLTTACVISFVLSELLMMSSYVSATSFHCTFVMNGGVV